ncbi:MAG: N-6 DNA methylase [Bacteroidota bacterium]
MKEDISIIDKLDFTLGAISVQASGELSALKSHHLRQVEDFGLDVVYFSGEFPSVYFKKINDFDSEESRQAILSIHKKVWNQGKVPFLYVESNTEVRVYNCYEKPVQEEQQDRSITDIELYQTVLSDLGELETVFDKVSIETGRFWQHNKFANRVKNEKRVEQELIKNLKKTRDRLKVDGLATSIIHNLLLRSLFILYLEDRKATDADFYQRITRLDDCTSYFDILEDKAATYLLFAELEDKFNGNLSPVTEQEESLIAEAHLKKIKECFWAEIRKNDDQLRLFKDWRIFNFEIIPIQLISEIYEEFLGAEDQEAKAKAGAFYTPHPLAEFVLNEVLPYPSLQDTRYQIKTLDPTCGSGIFLVETLNRLLDRWEMANANSDNELNFEIICEVVKENIFGIEINPEAIKVAAFSIYLAMLNRLNPKSLWQNKRFPYLINDPEQNDESKQGYNLFLTSSLTKSPMLDIELVVGNPPFSRGGLNPEEQAYLDERGYARELVLAFLDRVIILAPKAKYGLICGSKPLLFNNGTKYQKFRRFLFQENYVDKVYNFSVLRRVSKKEGGRNLFASAVSPISIVFYTSNRPTPPSEKLMYCAPKTAIKNKIIDGIAIDPTDVKYLPREECEKSDTKIWKIAMWGTEKDYRLLSRFYNSKSLESIISERAWNNGGGFEISSKKNYNSFIKTLPHLETRNIQRYYTPKESSSTITNEYFHRFGNQITYQAPHLLIKEGQKDKKFCASYIDYDCTFRKTVHAIHAKNADYLKVIAAFLNSSIASYLMFLLTSDWGIERERIIPKDILTLPYPPDSFDEDILINIIEKYSKIIKVVESNFIDKEKRLAQIELKIESIIWNALELSKTEKILIEDFLEYTLDAFQNKQKSIAYNPTNTNDRQQHAEFLCKTMNQYVDYDKELSVWANVFELSPRIPLNVTILYFNQDKQADEIITLPEKQIGQILRQMEKHSYEAHSESIYYRRFFRYYADDKLYIIKPNEKRFWSRSIAINDADEIIAEILNSK